MRQQTEKTGTTEGRGSRHKPGVGAKTKPQKPLWYKGLLGFRSRRSRSGGQGMTTAVFGVNYPTATWPLLRQRFQAEVWLTMVKVSAARMMADSGVVKNSVTNKPTSLPVDSMAWR